jgi:phosphoribosyl 1,2-cyclic phosphate phosphodiesterase
MKIIFLGTGTSQGIPVIGCHCSVCSSEDYRDKRSRCALYVETDAASFVIDVGPDFRFQMLQNQIDNLDFVLLTHEHNDHTAGLDDVRPFNYKQKKAMNIYTQTRVIDDIYKRFEYSFAENPYPGAPRMNLCEILAGEIFEPAEGLKIEVIEYLHGNLPVFGFRVGDMAYLTDMYYLPEEAYEQLRNLDVLIISALHHTPHHAHLTLQESLDVISRINPKRAYLIHMSHYMGFHVELEASLPENVYAAYDGLTLQL